MFLGLDHSSNNLFFAPDVVEAIKTETALCRYLLIAPAWSLSLEIMFYLIAPFLVKQKNKFIILLIALSLGVRIALYLNGYKQDPWSYRFFPSELMFFLLGILAYRLYNWSSHYKWDTVQGRKLLWRVYLLSLGAIITFPFVPLGYNCKGALFLGLFFLSLPFIFRLSKHWKIDRHIGELSYPLYIAHAFILGLITHYLEKFYNLSGLRGELCFIITLSFSLLVNHFLLKRLEKFRQSRVKQKPLTS